LKDKTTTHTNYKLIFVKSQFITKGIIIEILHRSLSPGTAWLTCPAALKILSLPSSSVYMIDSFADLNEIRIFERCCNSCRFSLVNLNKIIYY